jgi:hypothetical protein
MCVRTISAQPDQSVKRTCGPRGTGFFCDDQSKNTNKEEKLMVKTVTQKGTRAVHRLDTSVNQSQGKQSKKQIGAIHVEHTVRTGNIKSTTGSGNSKKGSG